MKYLLFLLWIPALLILYLSIHEELLSERRYHVWQQPDVSAHLRHPH